MSAGTVDLSRLTKAGDMIVRVAMECGWRARNTANGGVICEVDHEAGRQSFTVPRGGNINQNRLRGWEEKVYRYGDGLMVAAWQNKANTAIRAIEKGTPQHEAARLVDLSPDSPIATDETVLPQRHLVAEVEATKPVIVSVRPWLAARGTTDEASRRYESQTTVERKWSDGAVDYACSIDGCDFTDPVPQRVAGHYRRSRKSTHPAVDAPTVTYADAPYVPKQADSSKRAERLAAELIAAAGGLDSLGSWDAASDYLAALAVALVARRDESGGRGSAEPEPLTAEQTIERIRRLVDDGSYLRRIEQERDMQAEIDSLRVEVEAGRARFEDMDRAHRAVLAERDDIKGRWDALASLVTESKEAS